MATKKVSKKGLRRGKMLEAQKTLGKASGPVKYLNMVLKDVNISNVPPPDSN